MVAWGIAAQMEQNFSLFHLSQYLLVLDDVFIGCQQDIELPAAELRHKSTPQRRSSLQWQRQKKSNFLSWASQTDHKSMFAFVAWGGWFTL